MRLLLLYESGRIYHFDPESEELQDIDDVWVLAHQADVVANSSGIRINRNKELTFVAVVGGRVVGAVWSSFDRDSDSGEWIYSFDVAVDQCTRAAGLMSARIGPRLIDAALGDYRDRAGITDTPAHVRCWVVNPKLAKYLEDRYGFETESIYGWHPSRPHMTYRG
jgi:hypothetical protein